MSTDTMAKLRSLKQNVLDPFAQGANDLIRENREAWASRSKLKQDPDAVLSRRELFVLRQAPRDLLKSLPLLVTFIVPIVGYVAPILGYYYPKWTLPWQFWSTENKVKFLEEDVRKKETFYPEIAQLVASLDTTNHFLQDAAAAYKTKSDAGKMDPQVLPQFQDFFTGPAHLEKLSTKHLRLLIKATSASPFVTFYAYLPKEKIIQRLKQRADEISVEDQLLVKEGGVSSLTLQELVFACEERGIVVSSYKDEEALQAALTEWLSMYNSQALKAHPSSLVLHAPVLADFKAEE